MREIAISFLALALFLLKVSAKISLPLYLPINETLGLEVEGRNTSSLALPFPSGRCGRQAGGQRCPTGECCSEKGWCGTTSEYCLPSTCQMQCPGPLPKGLCGMQADGRPCPTGQCCQITGWCGTLSSYCNPIYCQGQCSGPWPQGRCGWQAGNKTCSTGECCNIWGNCGTSYLGHCSPDQCQSQCDWPSPPPPPPPPTYPQGRCGKQAGGRKCPNGVCCSIWGWCGTTLAYCSPNYCQSQCKALTSSAKNRMRGTESFLLNAI